jgi:hypothetical protein
VATWIARATERWARRFADVTITVTAPIEELLGARPIGRPERRVVIHNSADPDDFGPARPPTPRVAHGGPLELVYHGSLTPLLTSTSPRGVAVIAERDLPSASRSSATGATEHTGAAGGKARGSRRASV